MKVNVLRGFQKGGDIFAGIVHSRMTAGEKQCFRPRIKVEFAPTHLLEGTVLLWLCMINLYAYRKLMSGCYLSHTAMFWLLQPDRQKDCESE